MIGSLRGRVLAVRSGSLLIECGGIGWLVRATPRALALARPGEEATVMTTLTFAQDALTLYGFADDAEREAFTAVQTVSGIGPRIALAILAQLTPSQLAKAVSAGDTAVLQRVPGIGRKGAQRLVLELAGKLVGDTAGLAAGALNATENEVITALQGLGWSEAVAGQAVAAVVESGSAQDVASLLRAALRQLGGKA